jgi:hypothetical protein
MKQITKYEVLELGWLLVKLERYQRHLDESDKQTIVSMMTVIDELKNKIGDKA